MKVVQQEQVEGLSSSSALRPLWWPVRASSSGPMLTETSATFELVVQFWLLCITSKKDAADLCCGERQNHKGRFLNTAMRWCELTFPGLGSQCLLQGKSCRVES